MRDVVEAIDGPINLNVCLSERRACPRKDWCPAHPVWVKAQVALLAVLGSALIRDMADQGTSMFPVHIEKRPGTGS